MKTFTVRRTVDAYVYYEAEVEAETAGQATELAEKNEEKYYWEQTGDATFDARSYVTLNEEGEEIEDTLRGDL